MNPQGTLGLKRRSICCCLLALFFSFPYFPFGNTAQLEKKEVCFGNKVSLLDLWANTLDSCLLSKRAQGAT